MLQTGSDILGISIIDFSILIPQSSQCAKNVHLGEVFLILHFPQSTDLPSVHKVVKKMQSRVLLAWNAQRLRQGHERHELWHTSRPARKKHKTGTGLPICPSSEETFLQVYAKPHHSWKCQHPDSTFSVNHFCSSFVPKQKQMASKTRRQDTSAPSTSFSSISLKILLLVLIKFWNWKIRA